MGGEAQQLNSGSWKNNLNAVRLKAQHTAKQSLFAPADTSLPTAYFTFGEMWEEKRA